MEALALTMEEQKMLAEMGITGVILFGSQARGNARMSSDFDIGILTSFRASRSSADQKELYGQLYDLFSGKIRRLVDIDIVFLKNAPMELQSHVAKHGKVLYQKTPNIFVDFREQVMDRYADFAPLRKLFHQAILSRIP